MFYKYFGKLHRNIIKHVQSIDGERQCGNKTILKTIDGRLKYLDISIRLKYLERALKSIPNYKRRKKLKNMTYRLLTLFVMTLSIIR